MSEMKQLMIIGLLMGTSFVFSEENDEVHRELKRYGGLATIELTIKSEEGEPIQDAWGGASFWYFNGSTSDKGTSDENGKVVLCNKATVDGSYIIIVLARVNSSISPPHRALPLYGITA